MCKAVALDLVLLELAMYVLRVCDEFDATGRVATMGANYTIPGLLVDQRFGALSEEWIPNQVFTTRAPFSDKAVAGGCVFTSHKRQMHVFAFRGTRGVGEWVHNVWPEMEPLNHYADDDGWVRRSYRELFLTTGLQLPRAWRVLRESSYQIVFVGHSLGGALATLSADEIMQFWDSNSSNGPLLVTFGAPRVFNAAAAQRLERALGPGHARAYERDGDPVPTAVAVWDEMVHVGQLCTLPRAEEDEMHWLWMDWLHAHVILSYYWVLCKQYEVPYRPVFAWEGPGWLVNGLNPWSFLKQI